MPASPATPDKTTLPTPLRELGADLIDNPALWFEETLVELTSAAKALAPNLFGALAVLLLGWAAAFMVRWLIHRFGKGLDVLSAVVNRWLGQEVTRSRFSVTTLAGNVAFWVVLGYVLAAAAQQVGLVAFSQWVLTLLGYLPRVLISAAILFLGYLISSGARNLIVSVTDASGYQHGRSLSQLTYGLIFVFALLMALAQIGLDVTVFINIIILAAAALFGSVAVAFGLGASDAVRNVMASHYVRKVYKTGQKIRMRELEGEILELTQVAVIVETEDGEAWIPARQFLESVSLAVGVEPNERA